MKFDGTNKKEVLEAHRRWVLSGGENDEDRADFSGWNFANANFAFAELYGADFSHCNLNSTDFYRADLRKAIFTGSNMMNTNLYMAQVQGAIDLPFVRLGVPDTGSFIGWKRVNTVRADTMEHDTKYENSAIVKLLIPEDAKRTSNLNGECKANKVKVLEIQSLDGEVLHDVLGVSIYKKQVFYRPGDVIESEFREEDRFTTQTPGIYFYINRQDAVLYLTFGKYNDQTITTTKEELEQYLEERNHW